MGSPLAAPHPRFSPLDTLVVFVLGGPGVGKGTQCARLVHEHGFVHLSAGDLLREERSRPDSQVGELINRHIREGTIVPMHITIALLETAMLQSGSSRFLVDGFPRNIAQGVAFEEQVCPCRAMLFFDCPESVLVQRLMGRAETSGRDDDNSESIRKRLVTYRDTTMPVIHHYAAQNKVFTIDGSDSVVAVARKVDAIIRSLESVPQSQQ